MWRDGQSQETVIESQAKIPDGLRGLLSYLGGLFWPQPATPAAQQLMGVQRVQETASGKTHPRVLVLVS